MKYEGGKGDGDQPRAIWIDDDDDDEYMWLGLWHLNDGAQ